MSFSQITGQQCISLLLFLLNLGSLHPVNLTLDVLISS